MGRTGDGVEVREHSIRLKFTLDGKPVKRTLMVNGAPMAPTPANEKRARRIAAEIREKLRHGTFSMAEYFPANGDSASTVTVGAHLDTWHGAQRLERSTLAGYSSAIKFWKAAAYDKARPTAQLGDLPLRSLKLSHLLTAIASRPDLTGKTVNNYVNCARLAFALAVKDKLLTSNPADDIPKAKHQKPPPDPFTQAEADKIIADMAARYDERVWNLCEFWFYSGPRTSEVVGLRWQNVDLASGEVLVKEGIVRRKDKDKTKTAVARLVRLNSRARAAIERQRKHTQMAGDRVFVQPNGTSWYDERAFTEGFWRPTLARLKIRYRRPYNMRHTYATMLLMAGVKPAFAAKQLGHNIKTFLTDYADWIDKVRDDSEMGLLEAAIGANRSLESPRRNAGGGRNGV